MKTVFEIFAMIFGSVLSFVLGVASVIAVGSFHLIREQIKGNLTINRNNAEADNSEKKGGFSR